MNHFEPSIVWTDPRTALFTAPNPGPKTLEGTNTYVVGVEQAYLIDPGPAIPDYQTSVADWIRENHVHVKGILLSHGHPDHSLGAASLSKLLHTFVWTSRHLEVQTDEDGDQGTGDAGSIRQRLLFSKSASSFRVNGDHLHVLETPGHTKDHVSFWLENARILFSGDTILGKGTSVIAPPEGDMATYLDTLERLRNLNPRLIAPAHGPMIEDAVAKIDEYIAHRADRERQIIKTLEQGQLDVPQIVTRIYGDIDPGLRDLAGQSVEAHLLKLKREGLVRDRLGLWALAG